MAFSSTVSLGRPAATLRATQRRATTISRKAVKVRSYISRIDLISFTSSVTVLPEPASVCDLQEGYTTLRDMFRSAVNFAA